jgi:hypothetical protein
MQLSSRVLPPAVGVLLTAAGVALPSPARAADPSAPALSPGVSLSVSFGQKVAFGVGVDLRLTFRFPDREGAAGLGPFVQATWLNFSAGRFAAGLHGGYDTGLVGLDGEVGWTYHTAYDDEDTGQHGVHLGVIPTFLLSQAEVSGRVVIPLSKGSRTPEGTIGLGYHAIPPFTNDLGIGSGRPLRTDGGVVLPPALVSGPAALRSPWLDRATRSALAAAWLEDAQAECASIPAFLALARDLAAIEAPAPLVAQALAAVNDEIRHTALCSRLASAFAGWHIKPLQLPPPPPSDADRRSALLRLALESWQDGCLGEGAAAARARRALRSTVDTAAQAALAVIARDEARHAELAFRVLTYCLAQGGRELKEALAAAILSPEPAPPEARAGADIDTAVMEAHGRLARAQEEAAWAETWDAARREGERLLISA